jgi:prephenate dehydrogenase
MRLTIVGFGLIGGSIARALAARDAGQWHVTAWSRSGDGPHAGLADGVLDAVAVSAGEAVGGAELVLLAASPLANLELVGSIGPAVATAGATLTDVTSAQVRLGQAAARVSGLHHVGGHPMAGGEASGYDAARADLFAQRPWIVLPSASAAPDDLARVRTLVAACGGIPVEMGADEHDRLVAAVSHMPLVVAAALAETVTGSDAWEAASGLAAGGWRDSTRIARGDPDLGAGIAALNRDELLGWLDRFAAELASWRGELGALPDSPGSADMEALRTRFERVRAALNRQDA